MLLILCQYKRSANRLCSFEYSANNVCYYAPRITTQMPTYNQCNMRPFTRRTQNILALDYRNKAIFMCVDLSLHLRTFRKFLSRRSFRKKLSDIFFRFKWTTNVECIKFAKKTFGKKLSKRFFAILLNSLSQLLPEYVETYRVRSIKGCEKYALLITGFILLPSSKTLSFLRSMISVLSKLPNLKMETSQYPKVWKII